MHTVLRGGQGKRGVGDEGAGGGRRGGGRGEKRGGRREKRGREEGEEGAGGGRGEEEREGGEKREFLRARSARRSRRVEGDEGAGGGGGKGAGGGRGLPPCPPLSTSWFQGFSTCHGRNGPIIMKTCILSLLASLIFHALYMHTVARTFKDAQYCTHFHSIPVISIVLVDESKWIGLIWNKEINELVGSGILVAWPAETGYAANCSRKAKGKPSSRSHIKIALCHVAFRVQFILLHCYFLFVNEMKFMGF